MHKLILFFLITNFVWSQKAILQESRAFQENLDKEYSDSLSSPLLKEDLLHFSGLNFYPISEKYIVTATFVLANKEKPFEMKTSTEQTPMYIKYGELHFELEGKTLKLNVYKNIELSKMPGYNDYLFLPFTDVTCGNESYGGGRYIDMRIPKENTVVINFNKAYNPYCAYNYKYSCPKVPSENDLPIEILAGVKKFHD